MAEHARQTQDFVNMSDYQRQFVMMRWMRGMSPQQQAQLVFQSAPEVKDSFKAIKHCRPIDAMGHREIDIVFEFICEGARFELFTYWVQIGLGDMKMRMLSPDRVSDEGCNDMHECFVVPCHNVAQSCPQYNVLSWGGDHESYCLKDAPMYMRFGHTHVLPDDKSFSLHVLPLVSKRFRDAFGSLRIPERVLKVLVDHRDQALRYLKTCAFLPCMRLSHDTDRPSLDTLELHDVPAFIRDERTPLRYRGSGVMDITGDDPHESQNAADLLRPLARLVRFWDYSVRSLRYFYKSPAPRGGVLAPAYQDVPDHNQTELDDLMRGWSIDTFIQRLFATRTPPVQLGI